MRLLRTCGLVFFLLGILPWIVLSQDKPAPPKNNKVAILRLLDQVMQTREKSPSQALEYCKKALELAKPLRDKKTEIELLNQMCRIYHNLGQFQEALDYGEVSVQLASKTGDLVGMARAYKILGMVLRQQSKYSEALEKLKDALKIFVEVGNKEDTAQTLNNIGTVYNQLGANIITLEYYLRSLKIHREMGNKKGVAVCYNNIGVVYESLGKYREALNYYQDALKMDKELGHERDRGDILCNIGEIYFKMKEYHRAYSYYSQSMQLCREVQHIWGEANTLNHIANYHVALENYEKAMTTCYRVITLCREIGETWIMTEALTTIGTIYHHTENFRKAADSFEKAYHLARKNKTKEQMRVLAEKMSDTYEALREYQKAYEYYLKYMEISRELYTDGLTRSAAEMQIRLNDEKKERQIALLTKDNDIQQLELASHQNIKNFLLAIAVLVMLLTAVLFNRFQVKEKARRRLLLEIREHRHTHQRLVESEAIFRSLAEKRAVGIYIIQDGVLKYVNPQLARFFGYSTPELLHKKPIDTLVFEPDRERIKMGLNSRSNPDKLSVHVEFRGVKKNGDLIYLEAYDSVTRYHGRPAVIGTVIDISGRKKRKIELLKSRKLESVGILAGSIAHDFKEMLAAIKENLEHLLKSFKRKKMDEDTVAAFETLDKSLVQASDLARKLTVFSSGGWGNCEPTGFNDVLQQAIEYLPEDAQRDFDINVPPDLHRLYIDEHQFQQVLWNLLVNAAEADPEKQTISIRAENITTMPLKFSSSPGENDYVRISIIDKGVGIPGDQLESIFDPYYSTKNNYSRKGMGLGLSICYSIVKKHQGHITIESEPGHGTAVHVHIPGLRKGAEEGAGC